MRVCKSNELDTVFGKGGPSMGWSGTGAGLESAQSFTSSASTMPSSPTTTNPTFTVSPSPSETSPTYNGQTVNPVYSVTTTTTGPVNLGTAVLTGSGTTTEVSYYDNGVMCIDPAAVNNGSVSSGPSTDATSTSTSDGYSDGYDGGNAIT